MTLAAARPGSLRAVAPAVPTVGVEEEFFLLSPDGSTCAAAPEMLSALPAEAHATVDFTRSRIETTTRVCADLSDVGRELSVSRRVLAQAAADRGARLIAVGTPPLDAPGPADLTCAGQVHVEVSSRDLGAAVLTRLRPWLPALLALTGNSPLWRGRDTGWSSHRFVVQRQWPTFVPPPSCRDAAAYDERVAELVAAGAAADERGVSFWARLSPRDPTVEIRIADACLTVADAVLLAGLCRAAVTTAVDAERAGRPLPVHPERVLVAAAYAAARRGLSGGVVDPVQGGWAPAGAVLQELMTALTPVLEAAGDRGLVESLLTVRLRRGSGSDRQRTLWHGRPRGAFVQSLANLSAGLDV